MGVKDLGAVIKKYAPSAVTPITSLSAFGPGTRFAIDANLLTTKFHFVKSNSAKYEEHRHVRSWFWFLKALKREGISAIVVFDGETRVQEKAAENARRRAAKEQQKLRGEAEGVRGERLRELKDVWAGVAPEDRRVVAGALRQSMLADSEETVDVLVEDRLQSSFGQLDALHAAFRDDEANPIYSRNQILVTAEERAFFSSILGHETSFEIPLLDHDAELALTIAKSDALGLSHRRRSSGVPKSAFIDSMRLVQALGVPYVQPAADRPHEAEGLCSTLYSLGLVDYVVSEDTDVAVYGAPLIRRLNTSRAKAVDSAAADDEAEAEEVPRRTLAGAPLVSKSGMNVLDPFKLMEELGLTKEQFVDFALLCGTDFTDRIPFVGTAKALAFIREYGTIENILSSQTRYLPADPIAYLDTVRAARAIFLDLPPLPADVQLEPRSSDPDLVPLLHDWGIWARWESEEPKKESAEMETTEVEAALAETRV
ncbi:PIN domain-like protein [Leucosporidium creatinivorum]|uniref:PIN domain-like protein n=1 Tax=Leucosporidium creatinivorum TaxID=106004 RepID=A0A1Y2G6J9_9BASI|nr:PIN domain-like protein [Leucosporidium creatinivorum]